MTTDTGGGFSEIFSGVIDGVNDSISTVEATVLNVQQTYADDPCMAFLIVGPKLLTAAGALAAAEQLDLEIVDLIDLAITRSLAGWGRPSTMYVHAVAPFATWFAVRHAGQGTVDYPIGSGTWVYQHIGGSGAVSPSSSRSGPQIGSSGIYLVAGKLSGPAMVNEWRAWRDLVELQAVPSRWPSARVKLAMLRTKAARLRAEIVLREVDVGRAEAACDQQIARRARNEDSQIDLAERESIEAGELARRKQLLLALALLIAGLTLGRR